MFQQHQMPEEDEGSSPTSLPDINTGGGASPPRSSPQPGTSKAPAPGTSNPGTRHHTGPTLKR